MVASQQKRRRNVEIDPEDIFNSEVQEADAIILNVKEFDSSLFKNRPVSHTAKAGLNPVVDAASYLFSVIGKLKSIQSYKHLHKLQKELIQEINTFQETTKNQGYNIEFSIVCRYVMCALLDDIIANTMWANDGRWDEFSLLAAFNQDRHQNNKFFTIMERAIKEPALYIDLMELMYLCLSMGYKGQYRSIEYNPQQLDQITNNLYKHIRAYRGSFSKALSPTPLKAKKRRTVFRGKSSLLFIFIVTACIVMAIFVGLGYLMDVISNEAYKDFTTGNTQLQLLTKH